MLGFELMPWQQHVADTALEHDDSGRLVYRRVVLTVPRQSGKSSLLLSLAVHRALLFEGRQNIAYTAQNGVSARDKLLDDWRPILERSVLAKRLTVRRTSGHEGVMWSDGSLVTLLAGTEKSGHGRTIDLALLDEAFAQIDDRIEQAVSPAMVTRPDAQFWIVSTAGDEKSQYLLSKVREGRDRATLGLTEHTAYFEWSADPDVDPGSIGTWKSCMPALRHEGNPAGTQPIEAVAAEYSSMKLGEFKRAFLNVWGGTRGDPVIPVDKWAGCRSGVPDPGGPSAVAFDMPPDRSSGSIGAGFVDDGVAFVDVLDDRTGTAWMVDRLVELHKRYPAAVVVCDASGPAGSLVTPLGNAGVEVKTVTTREHQQACGGFYDDAVNGRLRHRGRLELDTAVNGAAKRMVGDAWLWNRKTTDVNISPLVAVTLARWAASQPSGTRTLDEATVGVW